MKERLVTLALAVGALFLCYALFVPKPPPENMPQSLPLSADSGTAGYQAAWRWLNGARIRAVSLRNRFDKLATDQTLPRAGNVLLTTMPHKLPVRPEEATRLDAWIERGNTLVIAAALDDTPAWALQDPTRFVRDVGRLARLKVDTVENKDEKPASRTLKSTLEALSVPRKLEIEPRGAHPLMNGVHLLKVDSDLPASRWTAVPMDTSGVLQVAQAVEGGNPAIWIRPQGGGQVIVLGAAGLFSNRDLATADNAKLLANIIGWTLQNGASIIFDDAHQGAVDYYDAKAFYKDPRLHHTLWWLVLLWFVFVLGIQRFRGHSPEREPADVTALVSSTGEFFASVLTPSTAGARLLQNFFNGIHRRLGSREDGAPVWDWLAAQAAVSRDEVTELRRLDAQIRSGKRFSLPRLQNLLSELQGKIA